MKNTKGYLYMLVDHDRKLYRVVPETPQRRDLSHTHDTVSMKAIIGKLEENRINETNDRKNPILSRKQKRIIAVLLAHALVQYCGSAWLSEQWDKNSISFLKSSDGDRLVLSTQMKPYNSDSDPNAEFRMHCYPGILALAIVMLEMELGKTIETARSELGGNPNDEESGEEADLDTDFNVAWAMFEAQEIQDDLIPGFRAAVQACLNFSYFNEDTEPDDLINNREKLYNDIRLRRKIYQEIIVPLESELYMSFPALNLDEPLKFTFWNRADLPSQPTRHERKTTSNAADTTSTMQSQSRRSSIIAAVGENKHFDLVVSHQVFFHDVSVLISEER
jgi:hypothetical protein